MSSACLGRQPCHDGHGPPASTVPAQRVGEHDGPPARSPRARRRPGLLRELALLAAVYVGYSLSRVLVDTDPAQALANGYLVLSVEQLLHLDVERAAIAWLLTSPALTVAAAYAYAALHYTVTPAVLVWLYRRRPEHYRGARSVLLVATCLALVGYWLMPTAPPRLLSPAFPDVLAATAQWGWWGADASAPRGLGSLTNTYAAMPSMHVGWALWCGLVLVVHSRRRALRVLGVAYPVLTTVVVVVTGNHFLLDAAAGAAVVLAVAGAWHLLAGRRCRGGLTGSAPG